MATGRLLGSGRDAVVYEAGRGLVWRCYKDHRRDPSLEAELMCYLNERGFPCPKVVDVSGSALLIERISGHSLAQVLGRDPGRWGEGMDIVAALHRRLRETPAPDWLRRVRPNGEAIVHMDLHPQNVLLSPSGPMLVDWSEAGKGPPEADLAQTWLVLASGPDPIGVPELLTRARRNFLVEAFLDRVDRAAAEAVLPAICEQFLREFPLLEVAQREIVIGLRDGSRLAPGFMSRRRRTPSRPVVAGATSVALETAPSRAPQHLPDEQGGCLAGFVERSRNSPRRPESVPTRAAEQ